jgi:hypothetical protein
METVVAPGRMKKFPDIRALTASALNRLRSTSVPVRVGVALVGIVYFHLNLVLSIHTNRVPHDAASTYLPGAHQLLMQGLDFFSAPESYRTAPLNFVWPALFNAQPDTIISANILLSAVSLLLIFFTARLLGGLLAGLAAAVLYGFSPLIATLFPAVLSEPLFVAGTMLWIFGTTQLLLRGNSWIFAAVAGGVISLLTRPVWLMFILLSLPALAILSVIQRNETAWRKLALAHTLILLPVGAYCLHNASQFGLFGISTGGGAALYLGNHPLTLGIEPHYLLFGFDVQSMLIPWEGDHLSIAGDRALRTIGLSMIFDRSLDEQLQWATYKLGAVMFFSRAEFPVELYSVRALRVFEWCFALYGLGFIRSRPLRIWFASAVVLQVGQLVVVLYNLRYSVGSLELWLIILASCGAARLLDGVRPNFSMVPYGIRLAVDIDKASGKILPRLGLVTVVVLGIMTAHWHRRLSDALEANIDRAPMRSLLELTSQMVNASISNNVVAMQNGTYRLSGNEGLFALNVPPPPHNELGYNQVWMLELTINPPPGKSCRGGRISYESHQPLPDVPFVALPIDFKGDGVHRRYAISATYSFSSLYVASDGILRFRPLCPKDTQVTIHKIALLESTAPTYYLSRVILP